MAGAAIARVPIGARIAERRRSLGLTQRALAEQVEISGAYMNLIEHDKRMIGGALLRRIAKALDMPLADLTAVEDMRLFQEMLELARGMALPDQDEARIGSFVGRYPEWAKAMVRVHRSLQDATDTAVALSERVSRDPSLRDLSHQILTRITSIRSFSEILQDFTGLSDAERQRFAEIIAAESDSLGRSARSMIDMLEDSGSRFHATSPEKEVDDFIIDHRNHFSALEEGADALRLELSGGAEGDLAHHWFSSLGTQVRRDGLAGLGEAETTMVLPESSRRFLIARHLVSEELDRLLNSLVDDERLTSDAARQRCKQALIRYAAAALLFPYEAFLEAAQHARYDVDRLAFAFGASFEQAAHRLVTLRRPGAEGVPFAFLRSDPAGNISKRFSLPGLRMPRHGGACPLWPVYTAHATPGRTVTQLALMPDGARYLFIAQASAKGWNGYGQPPAQFSVMLGCEAVHLDRLAYGDAHQARGVNQGTEVGFECRSCRREACQQRAHEALVPNLTSQAALQNA
ncbi:MAG: short-chain fatty acyl-CoA regulator family protein [Kiloniellales bacterium]